MDSVMQDKKYCYTCYRETDLELHHVFYGTANRKLSDREGCVCWLCRDCHRGPKGVHNNRAMDLRLKERCQYAWMKKNNKTIEDFRTIFGKSWL